LCPSAAMWPVLYILLQTHEGPIKGKPLFRYFPPPQVYWDSGWDEEHPRFHTSNETEMGAHYLTLLHGNTSCPHESRAWTIHRTAGRRVLREYINCSGVRAQFWCLSKGQPLVGEVSDNCCG
jgi:hypothetical protein